jgi:hypothetical protein
MIELPGLPAGSPITFMAALGLLRVLSEDCGLPVQLGWKNGHAVIDGDVPEDLVARLVQQMKGRHQHLEFNWAETTRKIPLVQYQQACEKAEQNQDRRALAFLAGWGTDAVLDKDGFVRGTRLDLTSGQQKLIRDLRGLALVLQDDTLARSVFATALFGGDYGTDQSSYGLDPATQRSHATEHQAPSKSKTVGKRGWIWLFAESIPLHPVIPLDDRRALPAGFSDGYYWPVWNGYLSLNEVMSLRALSKDVVKKIDGVLEVWHSAYLQIGKYGAFGFPKRESVAI